VARPGGSRAVAPAMGSTPDETGDGVVTRPQENESQDTQATERATGGLGSINSDRMPL
jgi:hypothetical protein